MKKKYNRPIVFFDLDETIIYNFRYNQEASSEKEISMLEEQRSFRLKDIQDDFNNKDLDVKSAAKAIDDANDSYREAVKLLSSKIEIYKDKEIGSTIIIRPKIFDLLKEVSSFADVYILTNSTESRANKIRKKMQSLEKNANIDRFIEKWFSSREFYLNPKNKVFKEIKKISKSRKYVLVDDLPANSRSSIAKHEIIKPLGRFKNNEDLFLKLNKFHIQIKGFWHLDNYKFEYNNIMDEIKRKLK